MFEKSYTQNCLEEVSAINTVKNTVPWTFLTEDLHGEKNVGIFYENGLQKTYQKF